MFLVSFERHMLSRTKQQQLRVRDIFSGILYSSYRSEWSCEECAFRRRFTGCFAVGNNKEV